LNKHQEQLKNSIKVSTNKIDKMVQKSLELGAFGAKINGSGFGGTMFALFPGKENSLKQAIEEVGGRAYVIKSSNGVEAF
jgi:galactokinase